jgi:hypothetical protein
LRRSVIPVALDQSAAFDCVDHEVLLSRLELTFGLTGAALAWVKSYFSSRTTFIKFGPNTSDTATVSTGIPQGSSLDPVLFPLNNAALSEMIESFGVHHHQYADDTQLQMAKSAMASQAAVTVAHRWRTSVAPQQRPLSQPLEN